MKYAQEIRRLRAKYPNLGSRAIAERLGCSKSHVNWALRPRPEKQVRAPTGFKAEIIRLRTERPELTNKEISEMLGCKQSTVRHVCSTTGLTRGGAVPRKETYFKMRELHPDWTVHRIAQEIGARSSTLYTIQRNYDPDYANIIALGRAAVAANLTLQQIEAMAHARHV
jgi:AraC-like DNA-binding protein